MGAVEVVLEGDVFGVEVVAEDVDCGVADFGSAGTLAGVVYDDGLRWIAAGAAEGDVGLLDDDLLAVAAGSDEDGAAFGGDAVDGGLDGLVFGGAVGGYFVGLLRVGGGEAGGEERDLDQGEALVLHRHESLALRLRAGNVCADPAAKLV